MTDDPRIIWLCERVPSFKDAYDKAVKARQETEESRKQFCVVEALHKGNGEQYAK